MRILHNRSVLFSLSSAAFLFAAAPRAWSFQFTGSGQLEIHHVNVQQGDCTLVVGPDGTTLLVDGGKPGKGNAEIVPYLMGIGLMPPDGLDYLVVTHRDSDHLGGVDEVINAGYDVRSNIWDNGSTKTGTQITEFLNAAQTTTAGAVGAAPLGLLIPLGSGATAKVVAVGGSVLGYGPVAGATGENDLCVALLVQHGGFDYLVAGDLGGGQWSTDNACTGRTTSQANVESPLAASILPGGGFPLLSTEGLEVLPSTTTAASRARITSS